MEILKKDGTTQKIDLNKIQKYLEWSNDPNVKIPNPLDNIDDKDISEKIHEN